MNVRVRFQRGDTLIDSWHNQEPNALPAKDDNIVLNGEEYKVLKRLWATEDILICLVDHE